MKFIIRDYFDASHEFLAGYGKKPTAAELLDRLKIERCDFDRLLNKNGFWMSPDDIYIDWSILKDSDLSLSNKSMVGYKNTMRELLELIQIKLRSDMREETINEILK